MFDPWFVPGIVRFKTFWYIYSQPLFPDLIVATFQQTLVSCGWKQEAAEKMSNS